MERNNDVIEIDLKELFFAWGSKWKHLLLSTIILGVTLLIYGAFVARPVYESTAKLYVLSKSTSITSLADIQMGSNLTRDYLTVVTGRPVVEQVIRNLELPESYEELLKSVEVTNPADTRILEITVKDPDPYRAKEIADEIADVSAAYIAEKMDQDPPNLIQKGYTDGDPVSLSPAKYAAIGAVIGLALMLLVVTISYLTDDSIMTPEDMEKKVGLHVLASLPIDEAEEY